MLCCALLVPLQLLTLQSPLVICPRGCRNLYGLEALARCAAKLLNEIQIEGLATGLNVTVQVRGA